MRIIMLLMSISIIGRLPPAVRLAMLPWASSLGAEYGNFIGGFGGASKTLAPNLSESVTEYYHYGLIL